MIFKTLETTEKEGWISPFPNDRLSVVYVQPGCTVDLWEHGSYGGWKISKTNTGMSELKWRLTGRYDNQVSTYRCRCNAMVKKCGVNLKKPTLHPPGRVS